MLEVKRYVPLPLYLGLLLRQQISVGVIIITSIIAHVCGIIKRWGPLTREHVLGWLIIATWVIWFVHLITFSSYQHVPLPMHSFRCWCNEYVLNVLHHHFLMRFRYEHYVIYLIWFKIMVHAFILDLIDGSTSCVKYPIILIL